MSWLLDVNVLVALAHQRHSEHPRVIRWYASLAGSGITLGTCPITELGFARVSVQAGFERDVPGAVETLEGLKQSSRLPFRFVSDDLGADRLPSWVSGARQVTDGHLMELARQFSMRLATLDRGIPGGFVLP